MALSNWDTMAYPSDEFTTAQGVNVRFYKNWLYVRDEAAWTDKCGWVKPTIMQVESGVLVYKDLHIVAVRHDPQSSIFAVCWTGYGDNAKGIAGIACYGFFGDEWVGVTEATRQAFFEQFVAWKTDDVIPQEIQFDAETRFNQGDKYFADRLGEEPPATKPGEASIPVILQMLGIPDKD